MKRPSMLLLFSVVFMDMVGFGFVIPILPNYIDRFGAPQMMVGMVLAVYALGQFIAAPVVGALSDRYGRKPLLLVSIGGTFLSLILLGLARSLVLVFVSRLLDGLTGGNVTVAQSYITDITDDEDRARGLGLIGMAFGLGFILGPLFGGLLVSVSLAAPAFVAAGIAAVNLFLIGVVLPESLPPEARGEVRAVRLVDTDTLRRVVRMPGLRTILAMVFFYALAFNTFETMFSPHSLAAFDMSARTRGFILAYMGVLVATIQGGLIGPLSRRFSERALVVTANVLLLAALLGWAFVGSVAGLVAVIAPLSFGAAIQSVVQKTVLSKAAPDGMRGAVLGVSTSLESINRVIAPMAGGYLLSNVATWAPGVFSAVVLIVPLVLAVAAPGDPWDAAAVSEPARSEPARSEPDRQSGGHTPERLLPEE